jgi:serine/threonine protein kinase
LKDAYRIFRAIRQRGKGGVYQALDVTSQPPRLCVVKEGRANGEAGWDGRDGRWSIANEERVLRELLAAGIPAPRVYSSFSLSRNRYLVTEFIAGENLQSALARRRRRLSVRRTIELAIRIGEVLERIHAAGWVWRDCKPANLIVTPGGQLRPIDFEGAVRAGEPCPDGWITPLFSPPQVNSEGLEIADTSHDMYAFGVILYLMLTGRTPAQNEARAVCVKRPGVPSAVCRMTARLLDLDARMRPAAPTAVKQLKYALSQGFCTHCNNDLNRGSARIASNSGSILIKGRIAKCRSQALFNHKNA